MTGNGREDSIAQASRWIEASGIPVHPAEQVRAWLDRLGVAPPVGIQQLMTAIRVGVIAAGDAGYAAGRAQVAAEVVDEWERTAARLAEHVTDLTGQRNTLRTQLDRLQPLIAAAKNWRAQFEKPAATKMPRMAALIAAVDALEPCLGSRAPQDDLAPLLAAIDNALRNGSYMTGANLAFDLLCDRLGVDRDRLEFRPDWRRDAEREG